MWVGGALFPLLFLRTRRLRHVSELRSRRQILPKAVEPPGSSLGGVPTCCLLIRMHAVGVQFSETGACCLWPLFLEAHAGVLIAILESESVISMLKCMFVSEFHAESTSHYCMRSCQALDLRNVNRERINWQNEQKLPLFEEPRMRQALHGVYLTREEHKMESLPLNVRREPTVHNSAHSDGKSGNKMQYNY